MTREQERVELGRRLTAAYDRVRVGLAGKAHPCWYEGIFEDADVELRDVLSRIAAFVQKEG